MQGALWVVATPLGNLGDMAPRAVEALREADLILAEDTRHSRGLCEHFGVQTPLRSLHEHNEAARIDEVMELLAEGKRLALISDAGTPAVSDPGARVVRAAHLAGVRVTTVPGPSALSAALSVSGFESEHGALFVGFLPQRGAKRERALEGALQHRGMVVIYESPHRFETLLEELAALGTGRAICVVRELSKKFESIRMVGGEDLISLKDEPSRGEFTVVLGPDSNANGSTQDPDQVDIESKLRQCLAAGLSKRDASKAVSVLLGVSKKVVYAASLALEDPT